MRQLICFAAAAALAAAAPASATTYYLLGTGFSGGATFTGSFDATDLDSNGQISSFDGEVTGFSGAFSGNGDVGPLAFSSGDLFGLVWSMNALIGDDTNDDIEGLGAANPNALFVVGPGPFALCNGLQDCAVAQDASGGATFSMEGLQVSTRPFGAVPEPASWALMIAGFGLAGAALRRRPQVALSFAHTR